MSRFPKRYRGVVLTQQGIDRLEAAIATAQDEEKYGKRFTQAELSERAKLSIKTIKKIRDRIAPVDETSVKTLFESFGLVLDTADYGLPELTSQLADREPIPKEKCSTKIDWGEKPDTAIFFGRTEDLATLDQWVMTDQCRLVTLLGMGGIGKTSLAAKLADQIYEQFDYVIWRSLREAPPLDEILVRLIQFLSNQQETEINLPTRLGERIIRLLHYLREHRCLLVLDNLESILQAETTGQFRDGYEGYGELIHRIGEAKHKSCLLLTSRECPRELAPMAGSHLSVRLWSVGGVDYEAGREILKAKGLDLDEADPQVQELLLRYSGNPQALHLVATAVQREFLGDVNDFLEEEETTVEDVRSLLEQHLSRLTSLERTLLFWLAINREPVGLEELMDDLLPPVRKREVRNALRGLSDRYLIETVDKQFTLQNVIMEFATDRFIERIIEEFSLQNFALLHTHALIKASAKNYVRETQLRVILLPVANHLHDLARQIRNSLQAIRQNSDWANGYIPGNLFNLICQTQTEIQSANFSKVTLRQAHLRGMTIDSVDLSESNFIAPSITEIFDGVRTIAFSHNGTLLASGEGRGKIRIWEVKKKQSSITLESLKSFAGHTNGILSLAFSPVEGVLASSSVDGTIRIWDIHTGSSSKFSETFRHRIWSIAFSPNGELIASGHDDSAVRIWDVQNRQCLQILEGHKARIWAVGFSPNGRLIASASADKTIIIWDIKQYRSLYTFADHTDEVTSIAFSPDGHFIASGSADKTVRIWDARKFKCLHTFYGHTDWIWSISFSPSDKLLVTSSADETIRFWDVQKFQYLYAIAERSHRGWAVAFSPDGNFLASAHGDSTIRLWDVHKRLCLYILTGYSNGISATDFSPDGKYIASGSADGIIRLWDVQKRLCIHALVGHKRGVLSIAFSSNGRFLASSGEDSIIRLWDMQKLQCDNEFTEQNNWVRSIAFSPDDKFLASGCNDHTIRLWDIENDCCSKVFKGHTDWVRSVTFSPDGMLLASGSADNTIRLWSIREEKFLYKFHKHDTGVLSVIFSPDSNFLASSGENGIIRLWDLKTRQCIREFCAHTNWVRKVAFSPNGQFLASGGADKTIRLWNIQKDQKKHLFLEQAEELRGNEFTSVSFSPDSMTLSGSTNDGQIILWNTQTGRCYPALQLPRPYDGTNITGVKGLTEAQRISMITLGAVDYSCESLVNK
ncbi:NB-ARC domain-containing protein [Leptothoe sp. ISB3NOV94-8A]